MEGDVRRHLSSESFHLPSVDLLRVSTSTKRLNRFQGHPVGAVNQLLHLEIVAFLRTNLNGLISFERR